MKTRLLVLSLLLLTFGVFVASVYAHDYSYYNAKDIKSEVKMIDKGIQVTITSDNPEIAKEIQSDASYYRDAVGCGNYCHRMNCGDNYNHGWMNHCR